MSHQAVHFGRFFIAITMPGVPSIVMTVNPLPEVFHARSYYRTNKQTNKQTNQLELLQTLNYDTAAAKVAVAFIQINAFKHRLFINQFNRALSESDYIARATKATQESTEAMAVLNKATATTEK